MLTIAAVVHIVLFAFLIYVETKPVRVSSAGLPAGSIAAYVAGSTAAAGASASKPAEPKKPALTAKAAPKEEEGSGASTEQAGVAGAGQPASGPVRLGSGGSLTLIKRVQPDYPPFLRNARMTGQVVLDAIIRPDGSIGDITVLRSTNEAFAKSAIAAVKQWRYTAPGYEGILTVTVNYTLT
jgi:periplasmic protein TonB